MGKYKRDLKHLNQNEFIRESLDGILRFDKVYKIHTVTSSNTKLFRIHWITFRSSWNFIRDVQRLDTVLQKI